MKTSSAYKLRQIRHAIKLGRVPRVMITGETTIYWIKAIAVNLAHSVVFKLDKGGGFLIADPDMIGSVWLVDFSTADDD